MSRRLAATCIPLAIAVVAALTTSMTVPPSLPSLVWASGPSPFPPPLPTPGGTWTCRNAPALFEQHFTHDSPPGTVIYKGFFSGFTDLAGQVCDGGLYRISGQVTLASGSFSPNDEVVAYDDQLNEIWRGRLHQGSFESWCLDVPPAQIAITLDDFLSKEIASVDVNVRCCCCGQVQAQGWGPCDAILGYVMNECGTSCVVIRGCGCVGSDCDLLQSGTDCPVPALTTMDRASRRMETR